MKYKIGDRVKIRIDSIYYGSRDDHPADVVGTIVHTQEKSIYPYTVSWDIGHTSKYTEYDIELKGKPLNDLNKLLYPDYIEYGGLLFPKR